MTDYDFAFSPDPVNEDPFAEAGQPAAEGAEHAQPLAVEAVHQLEVTAPSPRGSLQASPKASPQASPHASPRFQPAPQASPRLQPVQASPRAASPQPSPRLQPGSPQATPRGLASPRAQPAAAVTPRAALDEEDVFGIVEPERASFTQQEELKFDGKASEVVLPSNDALTLWQSKRAEELRRRRDGAREKKEQLKEAGKEEIAKFMAERETKIQKAKSINAEEEKGFVTDMATLMEHGSQWEKVHKLINLQPKPNEKPGTSRKERMRGLLIQLKHEKK